MKAALFLLLLGCSTATAAGIWSNAMPPARFRGPAETLVRIVPDAEVQETCKLTPPEGRQILACVFKGPAPRTIILPDPCPFADAGEEFARRACHEFGHVNGWSGEHPE